MSEPGLHSARPAAVIALVTGFVVIEQQAPGFRQRSQHRPSRARPVIVCRYSVYVQLLVAENQKSAQGCRGLLDLPAHQQAVVFMLTQVAPGRFALIDEALVRDQHCIACQRPTWIGQIIGHLMRPDLVLFERVERCSDHIRVDFDDPDVARRVDFV